jgi:hypothetical protein
MRRRNREIVTFSMSAIDLFCSGMGAVMVLMVLLMPYYRRPEATPKKPEPVVATPPPKPQAKPGVQVSAIDVVFVMDATGSMTEELGSVRANMQTIVQVLRRLSDDVNAGFAAYVDRAVPWVFPIKPVGRDSTGERNLKGLMDIIEKTEAKGGDDWPEDVCKGLARAATMPWPAPSEERRQVIVLIGDAETHPEDRATSLEIVRRWADAGPNRSVNTVNTCSTTDPRVKKAFPYTRRYFQELAKAGHGKYFEEQGDLLGSILDILIKR